MKRIRKLIKENKKLLFGVIIGVILTSTTVYAVQAIATSITYDNTTSGLQATNVQDAVDELYTKANSDSFWLKKYKTFAATPQYYAYGTYKGWCSSTDTNCNSYADFPTTETTPEQSIALEQEIIQQNQNIYKRCFQMVAAMFTRLAWAVRPPISTAPFPRLAT